jgi:pyruvate/2-oxoacid:ferredoxin oxidoreductase beta subunit
MARAQMKDELIYSGSYACPGCGLTIALRHVLKALGKNTVVITTAGCGSVIAGSFPQTISKLPLFHCSFGTAAATAAGLKAGLDMIGKARTTVLAWAGDGGTFDIGLQSLSGAAERNDEVLYVCYDNEAYMNTGVQRSSGTPFGAWTANTPDGAAEDHPKKRITAIVAAHEIPYAATACVSYPEDLERKVRRAKGIKGFRFIHVLVPCPTGWLYPTKDTIRIGRLAVLSRVFPLYEVKGGKKYRLSPMGHKIPVTEYLNAQGRFRGLSKEDLSGIQKYVDTQWSELAAQVALGKKRRS